MTNKGISGMGEVTNGGSLGLYQKHRPTTLDKIVGQETAVKQIKSWFKVGKVPKVVCLAGSCSGIGKTTLARIMAGKLGCDVGKNSLNYTEINAASDRGIDMTRTLQRDCQISPLVGSCRVWVLDEAHKLSSDGQSSLLKTLEDVPKHAYFFLCTTEPTKLLKTIHTRCTFLELKAVSQDALKQLVEDVTALEGEEISKAVLDKLVAVADGSPRQALVLLDTVLKLTDEQDRLAAVEKPELEKQSFDLVKLLLWEKPDFVKAVSILKGLENLEAEEIRRMISACARTELLKCGKNMPRAVFIIEAFQGFSDTGKAGHAWLARACYEVCQPR